MFDVEREMNRVEKQPEVLDDSPRKFIVNETLDKQDDINEGENPNIFSDPDHPENKPTRIYKINASFLWAYCGCVCLGNVSMGWLMVGVNTLIPVFKDHFVWNDEESDLFNTLISTIGLVGSSIGSFAGGKVL